MLCSSSQSDEDHHNYLDHSSVWTCVNQQAVMSAHRQEHCRSQAVLTRISQAQGEQGVGSNMSLLLSKKP